MSLELAAKHIAHKGRGPDTTLVHMSRDEVKSLNDLAMAHGGQLTINPETGLPEAGFLSAILPMVAGAALASTGVGAPMAAMMVGGGSYLLNPKAGLMGALSAGMGAYGGYGFGEGLTSLGATSEAGLTSTGASMDYAAQNAEAIKNAQAFEQAKLAQAAQVNTQALENAKYFTDYGAPVNEFAQVGSGLPTSPGGMEVAASTPASTPFRPLASRPPIGVDFEQQAELMNRDNLLRNPLTENQLGQSATGFDTMKRGAQSLFTDPTGEKFKTLGGGSYMGLAKQGLMAASPLMSQQAKLNMPAATSQKPTGPRYKFNAGMVNPTPAAGATGIENTYFRPQYTTLSDEEAKSMYGYAGGGPVEAMSNANAIGANTGFPQAYLHNNAYATPYQTPISQNVLMGAGDVSVDPYTGEQRMAGGGVSYDPQTQRYSKGISAALPENSDVNIYNDTSGYGGANSTSPSSAPSAGPTGQGISSTAQDIGLGLMSIGQVPGIVSGLAGVVGGQIADSQMAAMSNAAAATAAANAGGHSVTSDANGNVSVSPGPSSNGMGFDTNNNDAAAIAAIADAVADAVGAANATGATGIGAAPGGPGGPGGPGDGGVGGDGGAPGMGGDGPGPGSVGDSGAAGGGGGGDAGEARGGLSPYFTHHMAFGGKAKSYRTTLDDSLKTAYEKAQASNDTATMRAIEEEMDIRNTTNAGMEQGLSGMKGLAVGGLSNARYNLGGYSDGGRLLRGPGDGVSDSIPAVIGKRQPARLADGEFVVPARIVSELGNGSTEAGARRLYAMMDRIQSARKKTVGKNKVAKNTRADKYLPA